MTNEGATLTFEDPEHPLPPDSCRLLILLLSRPNISLRCKSHCSKDATLQSAMTRSPLRRLRVIALCKVASFEQWDLQRSEILGRNRSKISNRQLSRWKRVFRIFKGQSGAFVRHGKNDRPITD